MLLFTLLPIFNALTTPTTGLRIRDACCCCCRTILVYELASNSFDTFNSSVKFINHLHLSFSGTFSTSDFFGFLVKFGFQKTDTV